MFILRDRFHISLFNMPIVKTEDIGFYMGTGLVSIMRYLKGHFICIAKCFLIHSILYRRSCLFWFLLANGHVKHIKDFISVRIKLRLPGAQWSNNVFKLTLQFPYRIGKTTGCHCGHKFAAPLNKFWSQLCQEEKGNRGESNTRSPTLTVWQWPPSEKIKIKRKCSISCTALLVIFCVQRNCYFTGTWRIWGVGWNEHLFSGVCRLRLQSYSHENIERNSS